MILKPLARFWPLILGIIFLLFSWHHNNERRIKGIIWSDQEGYYVYLPGLFIYDDFKNVPFINGCTVNPKGVVITKYPYGVAALQAPFFAAAHLLAHLNFDASLGAENAQKWQPNAYSEVYARAIMLATLFYLTCGFFILGRLLRDRFGPLPSILGLSMIALATNLFYYGVAEPGMSHAYSFFLFSAFSWVLDKWLKEGKYRGLEKESKNEKDSNRKERNRALRGFLLGGILGLIVFTRPTNIIIAIAFLLWEVNSLRSLKTRIRNLIERKAEILLMVPVIILVGMPQFAYWQYVYGDPFHYSYGNETFSNWASPYLFSVLFSHQNGLFAYSPLVILFIPGLILGWKQKAVSAPLVGLLFLVSTYIFASWWAWWFGGAFGHRSFVEFYLLMAFPITYLFKHLLQVKFLPKKPFVKALILGLLIFLFSLVNTRMTYLYRPPWDGPNWTGQHFIEVWKNSLRVWKNWPETR